MILLKINNIEIDSSLLQKIDLECLKNRCTHKACCFMSSPITRDDINSIIRCLPQLQRELKPNHYDYLKTYGLDKFTKMVSSPENPESKCIFFNNSKCILEHCNATPFSCKIFPLSPLNPNHKVLKLEQPTIELPCFSSGSEHAYILLKKEILALIPDPLFYESLYKEMEQYKSHTEFHHYLL